jgi:ribosome-binding factor A
MAPRNPKGRAVVDLAALDAAPAGHRHGRLERLLFEELDALFRDEITDPTLGRLTVTAVMLSPDYRSARITLVTTSGEPLAPKDVRDALERATGFLRARILEALELKHAPLLSFVFEHDWTAESRGAT